MHSPPPVAHGFPTVNDFDVSVRELDESLCLFIRSDTMINKLVSGVFYSLLFLDVLSASHGTGIYFLLYSLPDIVRGQHRSHH